MEAEVGEAVGKLLSSKWRDQRRLRQTVVQAPIFLAGTQATSSNLPLQNLRLYAYRMMTA